MRFFTALFTEINTIIGCGSAEIWYKTFRNSTTGFLKYIKIRSDWKAFARITAKTSHQSFWRTSEILGDLMDLRLAYIDLVLCWKYFEFSLYKWLFSLSMRLRVHVYCLYALWSYECVLCSRFLKKYVTAAYITFIIF